MAVSHNVSQNVREKILNQISREWEKVRSNKPDDFDAHKRDVPSELEHVLFRKTNNPKTYKTSARKLCFAISSAGKGFDITKHLS